MSSVNRKQNYAKLRAVGYTSTASTVFKDLSDQNIDTLIDIAKETNVQFKQRFLDKLGKAYNIKVVYKI